MLVAISNSIVPMPMAMDSHSAVAISLGGLGSLLFHAVLGEIGDLVGERLEFGNDRQCDFARDANGFFVQLRNLRCGFGTASRSGDRFIANRHNLLRAFPIIVRSRLDLLDAGAILGRLGQFQHLVGIMVDRLQPGRDIVGGLLHVRRIIGETNVAHAYLHAGDRRLRLHRVARDRLLPGHANVEIAHRRVGPDLDDHHRGDKENTEARGDAELGPDREVQKKTSEARHE